MGRRRQDCESPAQPLAGQSTPLHTLLCHMKKRSQVGRAELWGGGGQRADTRLGMGWKGSKLVHEGAEPILAEAAQRSWGRGGWRCHFGDFKQFLQGFQWTTLTRDSGMEEAEA